MLWKLFEGEMIIKNQITISHQIFLLFMFDSQVIFISIINPNDGCQGDLRHGKVNPFIPRLLLDQSCLDLSYF